MNYIFWSIVLVPSAAVAATIVPELEVVQKYPGVFQWFLGILLLGALWLVARYIKTSDDNNRRQWEKLDNHETRIARLEGEHKANHGGRRRYDPVERPE